MNFGGQQAFGGNLGVPPMHHNTQQIQYSKQLVSSELREEDKKTIIDIARLATSNPGIMDYQSDESEL